ncbi:hypothetical protein QAD02_020609 [Eretmocerus hayati]|uniref:Uncharacterized protein n=1 Tax=Eretmocerus hayati TaxID=131215 RepID=A0ACC2PMV9_9HYME|nr:hypothetical protein QAD02_020609 [Eretmocerus hayati]
MHLSIHLSSWAQTYEIAVQKLKATRAVKKARERRKTTNPRMNQVQPIAKVVRGMMNNSGQHLLILRVQGQKASAQATLVQHQGDTTQILIHIPNKESSNNESCAATKSEEVGVPLNIDSDNSLSADAIKQVLFGVHTQPSAQVSSSPTPVLATDHHFVQSFLSNDIIGVARKISDLKFYKALGTLMDAARTHFGNEVVAEMKAQFSPTESALVDEDGENDDQSSSIID